MEIERSFGILLHPTSLPGPFATGVFGSEAREFVDWLAAAGAGYWQVLPLNPVGPFASPYQAISAFAGNPLLIDPRRLVEQGWLAKEALPAVFEARTADYAWAQEHFPALWEECFREFKAQADSEADARLAAFVQKEASWLADYALFVSLRERYPDTVWNRWPTELAQRQPQALEQARRELADRIEFHCFVQWLFFSQWHDLRAYAAERGVRAIGDMPVFVSWDSADVWAHQEYFDLNRDGEPRVVAGVPPDYFSKTGQLWGNPLYRWQRLAQDGYAWWLDRIRAAQELYDLVRIDHFRAFAAYWEIPAGAVSAVTGHWVPGPGADFFQVMQKTLGQVPVVAEDLGIITHDVEELRDQFHLPGMKVLQFAFSGEEDNPYLLENHPEHGDCITYTGTHDNDTTRGWFNSLDLNGQSQVEGYLRAHGLNPGEEGVVWAMIHLAMQSSCKLAIFPLQDVFEQGTEARMNQPSQLDGNWSYRFDGEWSREVAEALRMAAQTAGRLT